MVTRHKYFSLVYGYQTKILCIMNIGHKYCVSWIHLKILCIMDTRPNNFVSWITDTNIMYRE